MYKYSLRLISLLLTIVMLVNMLPLSVFAAETNPISTTEPIIDAPEVTDDTHVIAELSEKRTEYTKEFRLSNGLHMAVVYADPVHYEKDGQWAEIDNTLKTSGTGTDAVLTNTAGVWDVRFPQQLSDTNAVTITKDGYTLSFFMSGQLRSSIGGGHIFTEEMGSLDTFSTGDETYEVHAASTVTAQVQEIDLTEAKAQAKHPETVIDKNYSRVSYTDLYANTDVVYDLVSNNVKESIIIDAYDPSVQGYRYTLNVGNMVPVLTDNNEILLYDENQENVIMVMPAPYLEDAAGEYCDDVAITLFGKGETWILAYTLPQEWMADESRSYPVILDPMVTADSSGSNIEDLSVYEWDPEDYTENRLDVGRNAKHGTMRAFIKFLNLPALGTGDVVVDATLTLYHFALGYIVTPITVHKVKQNWTETTMTWANQPEHDTHASDYNAPEAAGDFYWDVTEIVRSWYEEGNRGLMLRVSDAREAYNTAYSSQHQFYSKASKYHPPTVTIVFRNSIGIEPYYTYATLGAGNAGGVYLSDSSGQITATRPVASYASSVNPFSANLIYNSIHFAAAKSPTTLPATTLGLKMDFGAGWTLDAIQKIEPVTLDETTYLRYWDGDGTSHYFKKSSGVYYDEDGLGLEIVANSDGSYTMSDAMDNKWYFTSLGSGVTGCFLTSSEDNNGNKYTMTYSDYRLQNIKQTNKGQSAITVASFTYSGNQITKITDAAGNYQAFTYSGGKLTSISHNGTVVALYTYDGYRLTALKDALRNYTLKLSYYDSTNATTGAKAGRVQGYQEIGGDTTYGVKCDLHYYGATQTVYHDYGNDRSSGNADDLYTNYMFDYAGRTVNAYTTDNTGTNVLGASTAVYTDNSGINKQNNRTLRTASIGVAAQKLLTQGSFELTSDNWTFSGASAAKTKPRTGFYSMKGVTSAASATASATRTSMALTSGTTYTLSAYVNTTALTSITGSGVYMRVTESNGTTHTSEAVKYVTSSGVDNGWVRIALTFTATTSGTTTVGIYGTGIVGTFYVDDVQLEKGEAPSNYNMVDNGDFQASTTALYWNMDDKASLYTGIGIGLGWGSNNSAARSMRIQNAIEDKYAIAYHTVYINKTGLQSYVISGWAMAKAVTDNVTVRSDSAYDHTKQYGLRATVCYSNDTYDYFYVPFNADVEGWQFASLTVIPESTTKTVSHINISLVYETNANTAYFDNIAMVEEEINTYTYDDNGNPTSSNTTGLNKQTVTYDTNGNVKTVVQKTGSGSSDKITTTYTYDSTYVHRMKTSSNGVTTQTLTHDGVGNVTATSLAGSSGPKIQTASTYTNAGNLTASVTDGNGVTTSYAYSGNLNKAYGLPSGVTNAKGTVTSSTYDSFGRVTGNSIANTASLGYTYSGGNLSAVTRTNNASVAQTYNFTYDVFGNMTNLKVGSQQLASYNYGTGNGQLTKQTYGNGDYVSFTYDNLGRVKTATYSEGRKLTYRYTGDGQLYSVHDNKTGYTYQYSYDSLGRLMSSSVKNSSGNVLTTRQTYDANNQLTAQSWQMGSTAYSETYTYSLTTGLLATHTPAVGSQQTFGYDALQRLKTISAGVYTKTYNYKNISDTRTTTQVSSLVYSGNVSQTYSYTYDALGNILTYTAPGKAAFTYTYDNQGQLTKATNGTTTYNYSYDTVGNITAANGHSYTYGNTNWRDLLTAYDGESITYDASGNPTSYYNGTRWTMAWEEGRRLISASGGGNSITYAYDSEGLRLSKTVGTTQHNYYYAGGKLMRETYGSNTLDFFYDSTGTPYALKHNGTVYYYVTNLQGDVMNLVNSSGSVVATYDYDPYGKVITATGTMAAVNPLRYRGYYYDTESGLYYLQSRYYDPAIGRFINADSYASTGQGFLGFNMFTYCMNNPVNCIDITGNFACTAIEKHSSDPMYSFAYDGLGIRGNSLEVEAKKLVKESTEIIERVISHNNQTYVTYDAKIDSNNFSKWKDDIETLSTVIRYYSSYLYLEIAELKDVNNHPAYWTMSQNHIYSEMMAHVTIWFTFGVDKTERVDLNVDENRLIALVPMLFWGFEGKDELEWRDVQ